MPTIEVLDENEEDNEPKLDTLGEILATSRSGLKLPKDFLDPDWAVGSNAATLISWRNRTNTLMRKILEVMEHTQPSGNTELFVPLVGAAVPFTGSRAWVKAETRESAQRILSIIGPPTATHIRTILLEIVRPAFERARPNENLNMNTATKAKRGIGADLAYYDDTESDWKNDLGLVDIVLWCLEYLQDQDWESLWPLVIPPVLTYMDDWDALNRLSGVVLSRRLVERAPPTMLIRTGIDQLIRKSLETSVLRFGDTSSPVLFKQAAMASLELTRRTEKPASLEYYQRVFTLLGESVIGGAWMFGYREPLLIQATYEVLPQILEVLGIACVRYLKALVPQLLHTLAPLEGAQPSIAMQEASLCALRDVIRFGSPRMAYWSGEIVSGVAKCWVILQDRHKNDSRIVSLLTAVLQDLEAACPDITRGHFEVLKELDPRFLRLVPTTA